MPAKKKKIERELAVGGRTHKGYIGGTAERIKPQIHRSTGDQSAAARARESGFMPITSGFGPNRFDKDAQNHWWYDPINKVWRPPGTKFMPPPEPTPELLEALTYIDFESADPDRSKPQPRWRERAVENWNRYMDALGRS
jgi:hypothetical protein